jgi:CMP/dCMP kinase
MGTVVFPEADVKFFLSASENIRAQRRFVETMDKSGWSIEEVQRDMRRRDEQDSTRELAPLRAAPDAVMIDSTALTIDQVVERMLAQVKALGARR